MTYADIAPCMEGLFRAALRRCGDLHDASDLTQEVLLAALQCRADVRDPKAWCMTVLARRHADMIRRRCRLPTVSIDAVPDMALPCPEDRDRPSDEQVRREVAWLSEKYREVIVRHYLHGEKVNDIAKALNIPKGTVLSRLSAGREQMKKGLETMEHCQTQSYQPERLDVSCHGIPGLHDEPWSLVQDDLLRQNILIAAYDVPRTPAEIARGLGVPTAYVEHATDVLVRAELMGRRGDRVFTDFMIVSLDALDRSVQAQLDFTAAHYDLFHDAVTGLNETLLANEAVRRMQEGQRRRLLYYFTLHMFSIAIYTALRRLVPAEETFPSRPDGGSWIAMGTRCTHQGEDGTLFRRYAYGGERRAEWSAYLDASIALHIYDAQPDLNRYEHGPVHVSDGDLARLLYSFHRGIPFQQTGLDPLLLTAVPHLAACGILTLHEGQPATAIPVVSGRELASMAAVCQEQALVLADRLASVLPGLLPRIRLAIPPHLKRRVAAFRQFGCYALPMAYVEQAVRRGHFDPADACPPMLLAADIHP